MNNYRQRLPPWPNHESSFQHKARLHHTEPDEDVLAPIPFKSKSRGRNNTSSFQAPLFQAPLPPQNMPLIKNNKNNHHSSQSNTENNDSNSKLTHHIATDQIGSQKQLTKTQLQPQKPSRFTFEFDSTFGLIPDHKKFEEQYPRRAAGGMIVDKKYNPNKRKVLPHLNSEKDQSQDEIVINPPSLNLGVNLAAPAPPRRSNNHSSHEGVYYQNELPERKTRIIDFMIDMLKQQNKDLEDTHIRSFNQYNNNNNNNLHQQSKWAQTPTSLHKQRVARFKTEPNGPEPTILGESLLEDTLSHNNNKLNLNSSIRNYPRQSLGINKQPVRKNKGPRVLENEILKHSTNLNVIRKKMLSEHRSRQDTKNSFSKESTSGGGRLDIKSSENTRIQGYRNSSGSNYKDASSKVSVSFSKDKQSTSSFNNEFFEEDTIGGKNKDNMIMINTGLEMVTFYPKSNNAKMVTSVDRKDAGEDGSGVSSKDVLVHQRAAKEQAEDEDNEFMTVEDVQINRLFHFKR